MLLVIGVGVYKETGLDYVPHISVYLFAFLTFFTLFLLTDRHWKKVNFIQYFTFPYINVAAFFKLISLLSAIFIIFHFIALGEVPVISAWMSFDYDWIVNLRGDIVKKVGPFWNYGCSFLLKAILPFLLLYFYIKKKKKWYYFILLITVFYSLSLIQKSYIVTTLIPVATYCLLNRKFLYFGKFIVIMWLGIYFLIFVTNPQLRSEKAIVSKSQSLPQLETNFEIENSISSGNSLLFNRVFFIPGKIVSDWFRVIPNDKPFLNGCGYKFIAPFLDCEFQNYSRELYPILYPEYAERGFEGTVNVASFMYEYSNFGFSGLILSALLLAILIFIVEKSFMKSFKYKLSLNLFYILMLSSSALSTLLFSGGWALIILLFLLYKNFDPEFKNEF